VSNVIQSVLIQYFLSCNSTPSRHFNVLHWLLWLRGVLKDIGTTHCTRGLDSGWWPWAIMDSATVIFGPSFSFAAWVWCLCSLVRLLTESFMAGLNKSTLRSLFTVCSTIAMGPDTVDGTLLICQHNGFMDCPRTGDATHPGRLHHTWLWTLESDLHTLVQPVLCSVDNLVHRWSTAVLTLFHFGYQLIPGK